MSHYIGVMSSTTYCTFYPLLTALASCTVFPFAVASGRARLTAVSAVCLACTASHQTSWMAVPTEFWGHVVIAQVILTAGACVLRTGEPITLEPWQAVVPIAIFGSLIVGEYVTVGFGRLHYVAHGVSYICCLMVAISAALSKLLQRWFPFDEELLSRARTARIVLDSVCLFSVGIVLTNHRHDVRPVPKLFHEMQAYMVMTLGVVAGFVAAAASTGGSAGPGLRLLHCFCWVANGIFLLAMTALMYVWPGRDGFHYRWYSTADPSEAISIYLALSCFFSALLVAAGELASGARLRGAWGVVTDTKAAPDEGDIEAMSFLGSSR
ncbi:hypothetical protein T492DRAFT_913780 [Pavlovales sp. CCMP2436]|nr:hypothetical protein T492DRAFT_913780 [Pavlovales sp. CCMP2436]